MNKLTSVIFVFLFSVALLGQNKNADSLTNKNIKFKYQALIIPAALMGYGIIGLESHTLKGINSDTKKELRDHIDEKISIDDFSQYSPFLSVYVLNAAGIKGKK